MNHPLPFVLADRETFDLCVGVGAVAVAAWALFAGVLAWPAIVRWWREPPVLPPREPRHRRAEQRGFEVIAPRQRSGDARRVADPPGFDPRNN